ncbi:MAG: hypothetical protein M9915_08705 [Rhizobacter sp.]|nr:hypothetical protein [Rhizobacter sp.]
MFFHALKTWGVMVVTFVPLFLLADYLPTWAFNTLFLALALLVFFPVVFAVGPLGRRIGRPLNEMAIAKAHLEREALRARTSSGRGDNQGTKHEGNT